MWLPLGVDPISSQWKECCALRKSKFHSSRVRFTINLWVNFNFLECFFPLLSWTRGEVDFTTDSEEWNHHFATPVYPRSGISIYSTWVTHQPGSTYPTLHPTECEEVELPDEDSESILPMWYRSTNVPSAARIVLVSTGDDYDGDNDGEVEDE